MKHTLLLLAAVCGVSSLHAATGDSTLDDFLASQKVQYEKKGWTFDPAKLTRQFESMDTNENGILSGVEKKSYWDSNSKSMQAPAPVVQTSTQPKIGIGSSGSVNRATYIPRSIDPNMPMIDPASDPKVQPYPGTDLTGRYELTFSDEFEGNEVNESKWYYRTGSKLWSTQLAENNSVSDGLFRIHLKKERTHVAGKTFEYTGGGIITHKLFRYGYYETAMKAPKGQGWHSSFWMMRDRALHEVPMGEAHIELDPVETDSSDPYHYQIDAHGWRPGEHRKFGTKQIRTKEPLTEWHVYGMEFTPTELRYYFNGKLMRATDATQFEHCDVNVWLSCLAGKIGKKTTSVDESTLPNETEYKYFRFYEKMPHAIVEIASPGIEGGLFVPDTSESLPLEAKLTLSEAGLNPVVAWSKVSGPGEVSFKDASALVTTVQFSEAGQYELLCSAAVRDVVNWQKVRVSVDAPVIHIFSDRKDGMRHPATFLREARPDHNNGGDNDIIVGAFQNKASRGLLSFDLSSLPADAVIENVELRLYNDAGFGSLSDIDLYPLKGSFVEGIGDASRIPAIGSGASWISSNGSDLWETPGGDHSDTILCKMPAFDASEVGFRSFPESDLLVSYTQAALRHGKPVSFLLKASTETGNRMCRFSSNHSIFEHRPQFKVTYSVKKAEMIERVVPKEKSPAVNQSQPNVLFISIDDLRPELGSYGSEIAVTPNMDRLASRGLLFERAYCQQPICGPSRASVLSGCRPDTIGITHNYVKLRELNPDILTLPQLFGANGYDTVFCGKIFHHGDMDPASWNREPSLNQLPAGVAPTKDGFVLATNKQIKADSRKEMFSKYGEVAKYGLAMGPAYECADVPDNAYIDGYHTDLAIATLKEMVAEGDQPFFLGFGMNKPHLNWVAPKKYWDLYDPEDIPLASETEGPRNGAAMGLHPSFELRVRSGIPKQGDIDDELARTLKHSYLACVSYVDAQIGRMIDALDEVGVRDNTIIILWSDHGFHLGDMGIWCKATNYEISTRVPMMVWTPDMPEASRGARTNALVELVDIYPTLCDLAGLDQPEHLEGMSFKPLIEDPGQAWKKAAFSQFPSPALREWGAYPIRPAMRETYFGPLLMEVEDRIKAQQGEAWDRELFENYLMGYAMRTHRYRLIAWKDTRTPEAEPVFVELYDHANDPEETRNIAVDKPAKVRELLAQLKASHN